MARLGDDGFIALDGLLIILMLIIGKACLLVLMKKKSGLNSPMLELEDQINGQYPEGQAFIH